MTREATRIPRYATKASFGDMKTCHTFLTGAAELQVTVWHHITNVNVEAQEAHNLEIIALISRNGAGSACTSRGAEGKTLWHTLVSSQPVSVWTDIVQATWRCRIDGCSECGWLQRLMGTCSGHK